MEEKKTILEKFNGLNSAVRILLGLVIGIVTGLIANVTKFGYLNFISIFGDLYINALKAIAPLLVFVLVADSLASGTGSKKQSMGIKKVIILYFISSFVAAGFSVIASYMFRVTIPGLKAVEGNAAHMGLYESIKSVIVSTVLNPIDSMCKGNYLSILFWAMIFGYIMNKHAILNTKNMLKDFSNVLTMVIQGIIKLAPFGVMGLSYTMLAENGASIFIDYGKLILLLVVAMAIVMLVINPIIVAICIKKNPYPLVFKCLTRSGVNAFFTRSSAANIPINMDLCKDLGLDEEVYSVTIPLGATINMAGAAVVITIMTLATCWTLNMNINFGYALAMCFVATVAAAGTAGTAGGSLMLIPLACSLFGIGSEIAWYTVSIGGTIGVIQDSVETAVNSSSDVLLTAASLDYKE